MRFIYGLLCTAIVLVCQCSQTTVAGGTSDTGNPRATATVTYPSGLPVVGALVRVRSVDYLSTVPLATSVLDSFETITDDSGRFITDSLANGDYRIEVNAGDSLAVLIDATIKLGSPVVDAGVVTAIPHGILNGQIDSIPPAPGTLFVLIYGLERVLPVKPDGTYSAQDLPSGSYTLRIVSLDSTVFAPQEVGHVAMYPESTTIVNTWAGWRYARQITINTSATGANVGENVTGFPLLIRLDTTNFDFAQSRDSGQDIRFTRRDGTSLPFEVDVWNRQLGSAAMWVLIDTVYGNNKSQSFMMHWGNPLASSISDGPTVFDTVNGYAGVWHMNLSGATVKDASLNHNDGTAVNYQGGETVPGLSGNAVDGDGVNDYILIGNQPSVQLTGPFTISAWVKGQGVGKIVAKHSWVDDKRSYSMSMSDTNMVLQGELSSTGATRDYYNATVSPVKNKWNFLAIVYDGLNVYLQTNSTYEFSGQRTATLFNNDVPLTLQVALNGGTGFNYLSLPLDEVRISRVAHSGSWMKLCYETQRIDQVTVLLR